MPYSIPLYPISFTSKCLLPVTGLVQSLGFLVYHGHWFSTRTPLEYPVVAKILGDFAGIIPQDQLQQVLDG